MMKKLLTLCAAVLMAFAVTGSAMAADAVTVYIEPATATYSLYQPTADSSAGGVPGCDRRSLPPRLAAPRSVTQCLS